MNRKWIVLCLFLFCYTSVAFTEPLKVSLSQKIVGMNESFTLELISHEATGGKPDFSPLEADFEILSNMQGQSTSVINGKMDHEFRWTLSLIPKRMGQLTIPAIQIGQQKSEPTTIEVVASPVSDQGEPIFLETEVEPKEAYEQTEIIYTMRLFRSVNLAQAALSEPKVNDPDAIIERVGSDREYEHYHTNGKRYLVVERKYAIFPQKSGELLFSPIVFEGQLLTGKSSFFDRQTQFKRVISGEEKVTVKPIPQGFNKRNWFAAKGVTLLGEWSQDPAEVTLGETVTWNLTIMAEGTIGNLIPDLTLQLPPEIKQYPDKPQVSNQEKPEGLVGKKQIKVVLIPSKGGEITIPEINLKWWDLKTDEMKIANLPATILQVKDPTVAMNPTPTPAMVSIPETEQANQTIDWRLFLLPLGVFLLGSFGFVLHKRSQKNPMKMSIRLLKQACLKHDAKGAETALSSWGKIVFPHEKCMNLIKIKPHVSPPLQASIDALNDALYGKQGEWNGNSLWKAFKAFKPPKKLSRNQKDDLLKELYPTH